MRRALGYIVAIMRGESSPRERARAPDLVRLGNCECCFVNMRRGDATGGPREMLLANILPDVGHGTAPQKIGGIVCHSFNP